MIGFTIGIILIGIVGYLACEYDEDRHRRGLEEDAPDD